MVLFLYNSTSEEIRKLEEQYGKMAMKKTRVYEGHECFRDGPAGVKGDRSSGRRSPSASENSVCARNVVRCDERKSIREISAEVEISVGSVQSIFHKSSNMHYLFQHMVPTMLTTAQKEHEWLLASTMCQLRSIRHIPWT
jgi:hypothetical protein